MAHRRTIVALLVLLALSSAAARPLRLLRQVGRHQDTQEEFLPHMPIPSYTIPGTDVHLIDTANQRMGGMTGGVVSNIMQEHARSGSTYDLHGTITRTQAFNRADGELRTAIGSQDHATYVQEAVGSNGLPSDLQNAVRDATGVATVTARGAGGSDIPTAEKRAGLALMDASAAVQMVTRGMESNAGYATRTGAASAASVMVPNSFWYVFQPTWWRR